jgi:hypothetical protein
MLGMAVVSNPTIRAEVLSDPTMPGGAATDSDIDFQISSVFLALQHPAAGSALQYSSQPAVAHALSRWMCETVDGYTVRSDCCFWVDISRTGVRIMRSIIVISLSLALVTPALAAKHHHHYRHMAAASPPAMGTIPIPMTAENWQQYQKNLRDAGYNPKNDYQSNGVIRDHLP